MRQRIFSLWLVVSLATAALWAATDNFIGEWKLNPSKSILIDQMKVESVAGNKYAFDFAKCLGGAPPAAWVGVLLRPRSDRLDEALGDR